jgi:hypothetical protein
VLKNKWLSFGLLFLVLFSFRAIRSISYDSGWATYDIITPTIGYIEWIEEGESFQSPSWIADGRWNQAHSRQILVKSENHIFASFHEEINWDAVNAAFESEGWRHYDSFEEFKGELITNPKWWLEYSWGLNADWLDIPSDTINVGVEYDTSSGSILISITCYITNIPAYFIAVEKPTGFGIGGQKLPTPLFGGLDLTGIYIGDFEALQWVEDHTSEHQYYRIFFKAPASILTQSQDTYSISFYVSNLIAGQSQDLFRTINIVMPPDTEISETLPSGGYAVSTDNTVRFEVMPGEEYPDYFSVTSGPPVQEFTEFLMESIGTWITSPEAWLAVISIAAVSYGAFSGIRLWNKRKTYYRLYRSMVSIYDRYSQDKAKLNQEIKKLTDSITKYFIEDQINDDQFDKLLSRCDDLLERAKD